MNWNNIFRLGTLLAFFGLCQMSSLSAQSLSENHEGDKIITYTDGSWRYFDNEDPDDIALLEASELLGKQKKKASKAKTKKEKIAKSPKVKTPKVKTVKESKTKKSKAKKSKKEKSSTYAKQSKKSKSKSKLAKEKKGKRKTKKEKNTGKYAKSAQSKKSKGNTSKPTSSVDYTQVIREEIIKIRDKQNMALEKERVSNLAYSKHEKQLKAAKKRKADKITLNRIASKYKESKLKLNLARDQNKVLLKQRKSYESLQKKEVASKAEGYAKLARKYNKNYKLVPTFEAEEMAASEGKIKTKKQKKSKGSKKVKQQKESSLVEVEEDRYDDMYMPGSEVEPTAYAVSYPSTKADAAQAAIPNCEIAFQGKDSFSGKKRLDLASQKFFSYTSKKMRVYFEENDMITCEAYLSSLAGGQKFLCVEILVASETAQKSYGSIEKQGLFSIRLVDGTNVNLYNNKTDYGTMDPIKKTVLYKAQFLLPNEDVRTLSKVDIDKVRLVWSTGYEDYNIYETDFLINQLNCLEQ